MNSGYEVKLGLRQLYVLGDACSTVQHMKAK